MANAKDDASNDAPDVKEAEKQDSVPAPSTEEKKPEVDTVLEALKDDEKETPEKEKAEETDKPKEEPEKEPEKETPKETPPEVDETQPTKADERKTQLNTEIRDLVSKRNALKTEVEKANAEVYQPATEQELTDEGMSATEAKVEALRQEIEVRNYNEKVAEAQLTISSESERVLQDFPRFNSENENYEKELAEEAAELLQANLIFDQNTGQVIGSNVSPYQLYKTLDRASGISTTRGQIKGQQDTEQMMANADSPGSIAPQKKAEDPILKILSSDDD